MNHKNKNIPILINKNQHKSEKSRLIFSKTGGEGQDIQTTNMPFLNQSDFQELYRIFASLTDDVFAVLSLPDFRFIDINHACERMHGYTREELLRMNFFDIIDEPEHVRISIENFFKNEINRLPIHYH
ncbi:MAG: PAS domain S-box protein, partial [Candidatus Zixiibacteriota bacterium]